jgi:hypothetical protein
MKTNKLKKRNKYSVTKKDMVQNAKYLSTTMMVVAATQISHLDTSRIGDIVTAGGSHGSVICMWGIG